MKTIGLIGGMSWESSAVYYNIINEAIKNKLGGFHSSKCVLVSVDFAEIEVLQRKNDWMALNEHMAKAAKQLESAGADFVVLCTNTMHLCSEAMIENISIPLLHIADATGGKIKSEGLTKLALLGTRFTMERDFYSKNLKRYGIETMVPNTEDRKIVNDIIYQELVLGIIRDNSRKEMVRIIQSLELEGAQGVILGCTEIPLLISADDVNIPIFDTTKIHAEHAVSLSLESSVYSINN